MKINCEECDKELDTNYERQRFCSAKCRNTWWGKEATKSGYSKKRVIIYRERIKREVFDHYDSKCVQCGFSDIRALQIDHISDNGAEFRRNNKLRAGMQTYIWLINNNFPDGHQLLCANCNTIKKIEYSKNHRK